jgi:hypothetical protein
VNGAHQQKNHKSSSAWKYANLVKQWRWQVSGNQADQWTWGTDATSCCWGSHASMPWWPLWWEGTRNVCCRCKKWCHWNQQMLHGPVGISYEFQVRNYIVQVQSTCRIEKVFTRGVLGQGATYSILSKHGTQNCIRCIGTACTNHVSWVNVFHVSWNTNVLEMGLNL